MTTQRVAIVAPHFAEYSERLAAGLAAHVEVLLLLNSHDRAKHIDRLIASEARVRALPMDRRHEHWFATPLIAYQLLAFRPDVIIFQEGVRPFLKPLMWLAGRIARTVLIVHDPEPHSGADSEAYRLHGPFRRWLREHASALVVHGNSCVARMVALGFDRARIIAMHHGVLMLPTAERRPSPEPGRILMFGRMEAYKGVEVLLDAAEQMAAQGAGFRLIVAGRGPEQARLADRIAALPMVEAIDRYLAPEELEDQLARASFVVAPYVDATQSGVLASTFGNGRPAVASDVGGLGDVVRPEHNGLLVPPGDATALAEAMLSLLRDPALVARLATGAKADAATALDWTHIAKGLLDDLDRSQA
ncbi:glycosyltransferase family 4 protein [Sphingomonas sp. CCH5-D11]|uniref:glycosyltransferase family 4 protein n=1 Tax=Sphingomonas sp. CCH5-D11 TaxID=1768786 RepID=UPI0009E7366E|nr:glycosyltransferase family 4 protein [Sphingomonas sp. CCH5-D11]